jgi:hypothetical protein
MGRKGDCRHNAPTESFFGTLKKGELCGGGCTNASTGSRDHCDLI